MSISDNIARQIFNESPKQQMFKELFLKSDKQKEAWMRYFHALSVACIVGSITVTFTEYEVSWLISFRVVALLIGAFIFLFTGLHFGRKI
jgi:hypothetical protein